MNDSNRPKHRIPDDQNPRQRVPERLFDLTDMSVPQDVIAEAKHTVISNFPEFDFKPVLQVYYDVNRLYKGEFDGYRPCNTHYHDFTHVTDIFLALARIIHGYCGSGNQLSERAVRLGLIAALMHDTGFLQEECDSHGTGAKYLMTHVDRSIVFMERYFTKSGVNREDMIFIRNCILTTDNDDPSNLEFPSSENEIMAKMLATADIIGQMADRLYLEKLLFLYYELREGGSVDYEHELDILRGTGKFYRSINRRITEQLGNYDRYLMYHFRARWNIDRDLYRESIDNNLAYLADILTNHEKDYRDRLRRGGMIRLLPQ